MEDAPRPTKVHRIVLLVVDHDRLGGDGIRSILEDQRYPNHCIIPSVIVIETREVPWTDKHPLNNMRTQVTAAAELFGTQAGR